MASRLLDALNSGTPRFDSAERHRTLDSTRGNRLWRALSKWSVLSGKKALELSNRQLFNRDANILERRPNLTQLVIDTVVVDALFVSTIASLKKLDTLVMRRVVSNDTGLDLSFLYPLTALKTLIIDSCPRITDQNFQPIMHLTGLEYISLRVRSLGSSQVDCVRFSRASHKAISLYGPQESQLLSALHWIRNLRSLEFCAFGQISLPNWFSELQQLSSMSFYRGTITVGGLTSRRIFSPTVTDFSLLDCNMTPDTLNTILSGGHNFIRLRIRSLDIPVNLDFSHCHQLKELTIAGKEIDGGILQSLLSTINLETLQISGCQSLDGVHVRYLSMLKRLRKVSIVNSFVTTTGCRELAALQRLIELDIRFCSADIRLIQNHGGTTRVSADCIQDI